jgi:hypothetical protein
VPEDEISDHPFLNRSAAAPLPDAGDSFDDPVRSIAYPSADERTKHDAHRDAYSSQYSAGDREKCPNDVRRARQQHGVGGCWQFYQRVGIPFGVRHRQADATPVQVTAAGLSQRLGQRLAEKACRALNLRTVLTLIGEAAGFVLDRVIDALPWQHILTLRVK